MVNFISLLFLIFIIFVQSNAQFTGFNQVDQYLYLQRWNQIQSYSYQEPLPFDLAASCKSAVASPIQSYLNLTVISLNGNFTSATFQSLCGSTNLCELSEGSTLTMNGNLNVAAIRVLGTIIWDETSQKQPIQWLCAGYVVVERNGIFKLSMNSNLQKAYVYIKNNGALHPGLRTRVFGGYNRDLTIDGPMIDVEGRKMARTWSLLYKTVPIGANKIQLIHNPRDMGWRVGDRILIAPTTRGSSGYAESYKIKAINTVDNAIILDSGVTNQVFNANILHNGTSESPVAIMSAEVINLSR